MPACDVTARAMGTDVHVILVVDDETVGADVVAEDLVAAGARGVGVNLGGDLRLIGTPPEGAAWVVEVEEADERPRLALATGGIATPWLAATVVAGRARDAEVLAKAGFLAPDLASARRVLHDADATALLVDQSGSSVPLDGIEAFLV